MLTYAQITYYIFYFVCVCLYILFWVISYFISKCVRIKYKYYLNYWVFDNYILIFLYTECLLASICMNQCKKLHKTNLIALSHSDKFYEILFYEKSKFVRRLSYYSISSSFIIFLSLQNKSYNPYQLRDSPCIGARKRLCVRVLVYLN